MRPRQFTDDEVLEIARRCFLEHGPRVSTSVIAGELGVSQAALFKRFKAKQALMVRALAPARRPAWIDHVIQRLGNRGTVERTGTVIRLVNEVDPDSRTARW